MELTSSHTKPNVLFLSETVSCNDGITSYCQTLARGLRERGVGVVLLSGRVIADDEGAEVERRALEASVSAWHVIQDLGKVPKPAHLRRVLRIIDENDIRVVNVHGLGMLMWGRLLAALRPIRFVATYHPSVMRPVTMDKSGPQVTFSPIQRLFLNLFYPDALINLSEETRQFLSRYVVRDRARLVKVYGAIDLDRFHPPSPEERAQARRRFGLAETDVVCLLAGRLAWNKGHDLMVEASRALRARRPDLSIRCLFTGNNGGEEVQIKAFALKDDVDRAMFQFTGFISDIREALWASDIFVMPSRLEGFAISVVEAMATGLPPIRTPSGGSSDQIVQGESGLIVEFEDVDGLSRAIESLADPDRRKLVGRGAKNRAVSMFGVRPLVDGVLATYGLQA